MGQKEKKKKGFPIYDDHKNRMAWTRSRGRWHGTLSLFPVKRREMFAFGFLSKMLKCPTTSSTSLMNQSFLSFFFLLPPFCAFPLTKKKQKQQNRYRDTHKKEAQHSCPHSFPRACHWCHKELHSRLRSLGTVCMTCLAVSKNSPSFFVSGCSFCQRDEDPLTSRTRTFAKSLVAAVCQYSFKWVSFRHCFPYVNRYNILSSFCLLFRNGGRLGKLKGAHSIHKILFHEKRVK